MTKFLVAFLLYIIGRNLVPDASGWVEQIGFLFMFVGAAMIGYFDGRAVERREWMDGFKNLRKGK